jgi:drug/metabolite transporter (DMT)-like permease
LLGGATAIATSALWVKVSEAGPVATAFWRVALATPFLVLWMTLERRRAPAPNPVRQRWLLLAVGLFFAGDLAVWHWSIVLTSVANSTLLANLAPIFVTLAAWLLFRRSPSGRFLAGLALAIAGTMLLIGGDFQVRGTALIGDLLGVVTAMFYAGYQITVTRARAMTSTAVVMVASGLISAAVLLPIAWASGEQLLPATATGWWILIGLALTSQVAGQSLIAYAMAHLPATFSSVALLFQPVMATVFAWILFGEAMTPLAIAGGIAVLIGIRMAHQAEVGRAS